MHVVGVGIQAVEARDAVSGAPTRSRQVTEARSKKARGAVTTLVGDDVPVRRDECDGARLSVRVGLQQLLGAFEIAIGRDEIPSFDADKSPVRKGIHERRRGHLRARGGTDEGFGRGNTRLRMMPGFVEALE